jgi:serine/threonine protein kinase
LIPSGILFIASDAFDHPSVISFFDVDLFHEFSVWREVRISGIDVDFRRIVKLDSGFPCLRNYVFNFSSFTFGSMIIQSDGVSTEIYHRVEDEILIVVKSIAISGRVEEFEIEQKIGRLINLCHPCIASPIGFVFPGELSKSGKLEIVELYAEYDSLAEIISSNPLWWTATMKAKTIVGIVLGLRFAHSFGLLHGCLNTKNIYFDSDHHIQISDFGLIGLAHISSFADKGWTAKIDVYGFASILFEIVVGRPVHCETSVPSDVPELVSKMITSGLWSESERNHSFCNIFEILKRNDFQILDDVDSTEVSAFVSWVESSEQYEN